MFSKIKNFNFKTLIKRMVFGFISASIKATISFYTLKFLLGYYIFSPFIVRKVFDPMTSYCNENYDRLLSTENGMTEYLNFIIAAPREPGFFGSIGGSLGGAVDRALNFNSQVEVGHSTGEMLLYFAGFGAIYYSLGLIQEYAVPPLMRSVGFSNYYTNRELNVQAKEQINDLLQQNRTLFNVLQQNYTANEEYLNNITDYLEEKVETTALRNSKTVGLVIKEFRDETVRDSAYMTEYFELLNQKITVLMNKPGITNESLISLLTASLERLNAVHTENQERMSQQLETLAREMGRVSTDLREVANSVDAETLNTVSEAIATTAGNLTHIMEHNIEQMRTLQRQTNTQVQQIIADEVENAANVQPLDALTVSGTNNQIGSRGRIPRTPDGPTPPARPNIGTEEFLAAIAANVQGSESSRPRPEPPTPSRIPVPTNSARGASLNNNVALDQAIQTLGNSGTFTINPGRTQGTFDLVLTINGTTIPAPSSGLFGTVGQVLTATTTRVGRNVGSALLPRVSDHMWNMATSRLINAGFHGIAGGFSGGTIGAIRGAAQGFMYPGNTDPYGPGAVVVREKSTGEKFIDALKDWAHHV